MARRRRVLVALADIHSGHKLGLLNPRTVLYDEDEEGNPVPFTPELSATQRYLWRTYEEDRAAVSALARRSPLTILHNGDLTQGRKYGQQLVSTRDADQFAIAAANMAPWLLGAEGGTKLRLIQGTGSHGYYEATAAITVAQMLSPAFPQCDIGTLRHGLFTIGGLTFDCAHHGPYPGSRKWLKGNVARYYLKSLMMEEILAGRTPPRFVLRAHYHNFVWETVRMTANGQQYTSDLIILPSYCGLSEYAQQASRSTHILQNGLVAFVIEDSNATVHPMIHTVDLRTREEL